MERSRLVAIAACALSLGISLAGRASALSFNDLAAFQGAADTLALIDFERTGTGDTPVRRAQIGDTYSAAGVSFPTGNFFEELFDAVSGDWGWVNNTYDFDDGSRVFDAVFLSPGIRAVGVHNSQDAGVPNGSLLEAFDSANHLLASALSDGIGSTKDFFGVTTAQDVARVTIRALRPRGWALDDFYFGSAKAVQDPNKASPSPTSVPEPSTLVLTALGLGGLGLRLRRRR